ncbi:MAG: DUF2238 domain-containing protein [Phycisphaerae bacterium]
MLLTKKERPLLVANVILLGAFGWMALRPVNYEFILYVVVIAAVGGLIVWRQRAIRFSLPILWGLTLWGLLHMAGGNLHVAGGTLYDFVLIPLVGPPYNILGYDDVVHMFGFGVATLVCHHLLVPYLRDDLTNRRTLGFLVVLMGLGMGAVNELIEFVAVVILPETGVGGYENTLLDMVFNLIGAMIAAGLVVRRAGRAG